MKNITYVSNVLFLLLVIGSILLMTSVKSVSAGYGFNLFGLLGLLIINVLFVSKENIDAPLLTLILKILRNNWFIVALIGAVSWMLSQVITHYKKIIDKRTPIEYSRLFMSSNILNIFLFVMLYKLLNDTSESALLNRQSFMTLYILLLSIQYLLTTFQYVILNYYTTDG